MTPTKGGHEQIEKWSKCFDAHAKENDTYNSQVQWIWVMLQKGATNDGFSFIIMDANKPFKWIV